jgi:hypothetical protein
LLHNDKKFSGLYSQQGIHGSVVVKQCATSRKKVAGSIPDEVNTFFSIYVILPAALGPEVYSTSNRNEYQKQNNVSGE